MKAIALSNTDLATLYLALEVRARTFEEQGQKDVPERLEALSLKIAQMQKLGVSAVIVEVPER